MKQALVVAMLSTVVFGCAVSYTNWRAKVRPHFVARALLLEVAMKFHRDANGAVPSSTGAMWRTVSAFTRNKILMLQRALDWSRDCKQRGMFFTRASILALVVIGSTVACGGAETSSTSSGSSSGASGSSGTSGSSSGASGSSGSSGASGSTSSSGASGSSGNPPAVIFDANVCGPDGYRMLRDVSFRGVLGQADYIEIRDEVNPEDIQGGMGGFSPYSKKVEGRGEMCKGAADAAACTASFEALRSKAGWIRHHSVGTYRPSSHLYLAYTSGDTVGIVDSNAALLPLIQPVVSMENAALIVTLMHNHSFLCDKPQVKANQTEFLFDVRSGSPCSAGGVKGYLDHVSTPMGLLTSTDERQIEKGQACQ